MPFPKDDTKNYSSIRLFKTGYLFSGPGAKKISKAEALDTMGLVEGGVQKRKGSEERASQTVT